MVLSLVVVPARADAPADGYAITGKATISASASTSVDRGTEITFTLDTSSLGVTKTEGGTTTSLNSETDYRFDYAWSGATAQGNGLSAKVTPMTPGTLNPSCTIKAIVGSTVVAQQVVALATAITVNDKLLPGDITTVTFNGRTYSVTDGTVNISLLDKETIASADNKWSAAATGYVIDNTTNKPTYSDSTRKLTVRVKDSALMADVTVNATTPTVTAAASLTEVISGGKTTLTATSTGLSNAATYAWFCKIGDSKETPIGTGKSLVWTVPANVTTATNYSVYCKASEGDKLAKTSDPITVKSLPDTYTFTVVPASVTLTQIGQTATLAANFVNTSASPAAPVTPTYSFVSANLNIATVTNQTTAAPTVTLRASGSTTVTAKATYKGKDYVQNIPVTGALIQATPSAVQNGTSVHYRFRDFLNAAHASLNKPYSTA